MRPSLSDTYLFHWRPYKGFTVLESPNWVLIVFTYSDSDFVSLDAPYDLGGWVLPIFWINGMSAYIIFSTHRNVFNVGDLIERCL
jgi:hypothetical protein